MTYTLISILFDCVFNYVGLVQKSNRDISLWGFAFKIYVDSEIPAYHGNYRVLLRYSSYRKPRRPSLGVVIVIFRYTFVSQDICVPLTDASLLPSG